MDPSQAISAVLAASLAVVLAAIRATAEVDDPSGSGTGARRSAEPLVIGHRGASAYRPEHTLAAYQLAIDMGADFIESDLVATSDGALVARHENEIGTTTDVAGHPEFAARRTTKVVDGVCLTGWFTEDFTLAELKTLRATERIPELHPKNAGFGGVEAIATFEEVLELARGAGVGVYAETKHPTYFEGIGLSLEEPLVATLEAYGWRHRSDPVYIQSFETGNLRRLGGMTGLRLVQLIGATGRPYDLEASGDPRTYDDLASPSGLGEIARYANGVSPDKDRIVPRGADRRLLEPTTLVDDAHHWDLVVHAYTFRNENASPANVVGGDPASPVSCGASGDAPAEYRLFYDLGVDGVFSDNPDTAVAARWAAT